MLNDFREVEGGDSFYISGKNTPFTGIEVRGYTQGGEKGLGLFITNLYIFLYCNYVIIIMTFSSLFWGSPPGTWGPTLRMGSSGADHMCGWQFNSWT